MSVAEEYTRHLDEIMRPEQSDAFVIDNDSAADWALRKIGEAERNKAQRAAFVEAEIERLRQWQSQLDDRDEQTIERMTSLLEPYYRQLREAGVMGKGKTYKLPHGELTARKSAPKFERDDSILLPWARQYELTKVTESVAWADLKKRLIIAPGGTVADKETGEPVPGVVVAEVEGEAFSVKVDSGEGI